MKTPFTAASFALIVALSGLSAAHAGGFNDRSVISDTALIPTARQDLSYVPVHGFNQKSHHAEAALASSVRTDRTRAVAGAHCDLAPRFGFHNSSSFAPC